MIAECAPSCSDAIAVSASAGALVATTAVASSVAAATAA
jgi:hypothetical protein